MDRSHARETCVQLVAGFYCIKAQPSRLAACIACVYSAALGSLSPELRQQSKAKAGAVHLSRARVGVHAHACVKYRQAETAAL